MALFKGSKKVAPIINIATTVRNQNKTVTANGSYTADEGYTGLGTVNVNMPEKDLRNQSITVTENNTTVLYSHEGFDGYDKVTIVSNLPMQEKEYTITEADLSNTTVTITPNSAYAGMSSITIDLSEIVRLLSEI